MSVEQDWTVARVAKLPHCDICQQHDARYDGPVDRPNGPWGYMCQDCFDAHHAYKGELGVGKGQRLIVPGWAR